MKFSEHVVRCDVTSTYTHLVLDAFNEAGRAAGAVQQHRAQGAVLVGDLRKEAEDRGTVYMYMRITCCHKNNISDYYWTYTLSCV